MGKIAKKKKKINQITCYNFQNPLELSYCCTECDLPHKNSVALTIHMKRMHQLGPPTRHNICFQRLGSLCNFDEDGILRLSLKLKVCNIVLNNFYVQVEKEDVEY